MPFPDVDLASTYFMQRLAQARQADKLTASMQFDLARTPMSDDELEDIVDEFLKPILEGKADVVYGTRFVGGDSHRVLYFWHSLGNRFLTLLSNVFTNLNLTDMEVCYKVFRRCVLDEIKLKEKRLGFEPEFTAKIARTGYTIYEVGISYYGRTYEEGKKINWKDGVRAIFVILKYGLFR